MAIVNDSHRESTQNGEPWLTSFGAVPIKLHAILVSYAAALFIIQSHLSLWLDEILQLTGVRDLDFTALMQYVRENPGGVPLGYVAQFATVRLFGYSAIAARAPSILFSISACYGIFFLARRLRMQLPVLPVIFFAICPLHFRYAMEGRPYSQALCLTIWSTVAFFSIMDVPTLSRSIAYFILVVAGLYTQPFTLFVPLAHLAWTFSSSRTSKNWRYTLQISAVICAAILTFVPWYYYASATWKAGLRNEHYHLSAHSLLLVLRELVGAGYIGSISILLLSALGLQRIRANERLLWLAYFAIPICGAIAIDAAFGYFLAIRQMIFVLVPLSLLASLGLERVAQRGYSVARIVASGVGIVMLIADVKFLQRPRENWKDAATMLIVETRDDGCIIFVPGESDKLYHFFEKAIANKRCASEAAEIKEEIVAVAVSPYEPEAAFWLLDRRLLKARTRVASANFAGPQVVIYRGAP
jgi:uncharacterized membrane protein